MKNKAKLFLPALMAAGLQAPNVSAVEIPTNTAQMQAMDKITGRVSVIDVPVNAEVRFGSFSIIVRACKTRSPEETPENFAFVDVADTVNGNEQVNIFKGWMLSSSPALNAIEHPVYDVWLLKCVDTDTSSISLLTTEELQAREELPMQRSENFQTQKARKENSFSETNLSGEPIDLLPKAVRDAGEESVAQDEIIKLQIEENTPADENAPHSLLNLPEKQPTAGLSEIKEINAQIEITENTADESGAEIKSDARILSLPEIHQTADTSEATMEIQSNSAPTLTGDTDTLSVVGENQTETLTTDGIVNQNAVTFNQASSVADTPFVEEVPADVNELTVPADHTLQNAPAIEKQPTENDNNLTESHGIDQDTLSELEKELSREMLNH